MTNKIIYKRDWTVERHGAVTEVIREDQQILYHVEIWDGNRPPFISQWFNDPVPASDFVDRVMGGFDPRQGRKGGT